MVVAARMWLTVVPMLWRALHDGQGISAVIAVGLCVTLLLLQVEQRLAA